MGQKSTAYRIVLAQFAMALVATAAARGLWDGASALAVLAGGLIGVASNLYVAIRLFGGDAVRPAAQALKRLFAAEAVKFALTVALFALAIGVLRLAPLPLLAGYGLTLVVYWLALLPARPRLEPN